MNAVTLTHLLAATLALALGAWQLIAARRGLRHRAVGYFWVLSMAVAAVSSFWLTSWLGFAWAGGLSPIHLLSAWTLVSLTVAVRAAMRRDFVRHRRFITGAYVGLCVAGVFAAASPGRVLNTMLFVELPRLIATGWAGATMAAL